MVDQYIFSGSLPEKASTYVTREADAQLYEGLKAGKFCYVLNSRQSGKSSLRVRTMQRLREDGVQCAAVDLSAGGIQNVPPEQWYADLIDTLIDTFGLDLDFGDWWSENQLNTLVTRFRKFLEEVLLVEVKENIVIFIDEIDSVLSLNFPTDDFFALIRACYNKRVDNPPYNRLTFCLLGVASPTSLIQDKQRTPFNIGQAISLKGFQLHEAEPLEKGLQGKFNSPQAIIQDILQWTGGQPFLTQKLCQFMVEEFEQDNPRSVEQVVKSRIIENWESQDEPEHLRTIQARILRDEQRAGYLLELYQQVRFSEERSQVIADETLEQSELQLSGLVVRQEGKLRIYNQIYREIFDFNWIETQLNSLRPYSESFRFWVASGCTDESRLLRGNALQEAEEWAKDKNLSYQDKQFLAASKEKEIQAEITTKQQEAALERERQDKEAAEARNQLLSEANKKAQRRISIGFVVLVVAVLGAATVAGLAKQNVDKSNERVKTANSQVDKANEKVKTATSQVDAANKRVQNADDQVDKANEKVKTATSQVDVANKRVQAANSQVDKANENLEQAQIKIREAQTKEQEANHSAARAINQEKQARKEVKDANENVKQAKNRETEILAKLKAKENELKQTSAKNEETKAEILNVRQLVALAGQLRNQSSSDSDEALRLAALSFNIDNHKLKQALLLSAKSQAYQKLKDWSNAKDEIQKSQSYLSKADKKVLEFSEGLQVQVLVQRTQGDLLAQDEQTQEAIASYSQAFNILKAYPNETDFTKDNQLLTGENIESVYRSLRQLNSKNKEVETQLTQHLYAQLEYFLKAKNWEAADLETYKLMLNIAKREEETYLDYEQINSFSCPDLQRIDQLWVNADKRFGFSVQKEIWISTGNTLGIKPGEWTDKDTENYLQFARAVGWYDDKLDVLISRIKLDFVRRGGLPVRRSTWVGGVNFGEGLSSLALRLVNCNI
ncbi:AAA-like domain-containing protein [Nostoc sp. FACHB-87]|uniref:AAA-like domain-containing protein n=1 Tax=Nostocaceae TaxID=1162 RepID=UPI0016845179|nr:MULTISPECIES: AAA-like domain-containing protein [Nostocaceae]MBD2459083.1 AAA-like domain-containing protein [Nostoc sp. FACHB-87]MBD2480111.1 AAA-like domain-containing protein [Anabaena sp. FACHB-83]